LQAQLAGNSVRSAHPAHRRLGGDSHVLAVTSWIVVKGHLPYLWREWITSVDHKRIGGMYVLLGLAMLVRGFIDAIMMRSSSVRFPLGGYLPPEHYDQIFSAHVPS